VVHQTDQPRPVLLAGRVEPARLGQARRVEDHSLLVADEVPRLAGRRDGALEREVVERNWAISDQGSGRIWVAIHTFAGKRVYRGRSIDTLAGNDANR
jgi:hypothetical protein